MIPARPYTATLSAGDVLTVRSLMIAGLSLSQIADLLSLSAKQIDQSLWSWMGVKL